MPDTPTAPAPAAPRGILWTNLITVVSAAILLGAETVGVGFAFGWAISGLFGFGETLTRVVEFAFVLVGASAIWWFLRNAFAVEPWRG